uniref:PawS-like protein 1c n=1 Tax=Steirodiscus tagetes TaxID=462574 RepID=A0A1V0JB78_9ASTR|nr:PawS-like protein 1c [Steirodiscus tagetes]
MAKLALVALAFVAIVAFASAYRTTITTTIVDDNYLEEYTHDSLSNKKGISFQCRQEIPIQEVNHCQMHLTEGILFQDKLKMVVDNKQQQQHLQMCCRQLNNVDQQCQCNAIQVVFDEARMQGGGVIKMRQMLDKAQNLPKDCKLQVKDCPLVSPRA